MTLGRIAWLTGWLAATQLIATSAHAADTQAPDAPAAPPASAAPPAPAAPAPDPWQVAPPVGQPVPPPAPAYRPIPPGPVVHVRSPRAETELQLRTTEGWETACVGPCNQVLNPGAAYRVNGPGIRPSQHFLLPPAGRVNLDVTPGSGPRYWTGLGMTLGGLGTMGYGLLLSSVSSHSCSAYDSYCSNSSDGLDAVGGAFLIVGGIVSVVGLILWLSNNTQVAMH